MKRNQLIPIIGMSCVYLVFVTSAFNYQHYPWFHYLVSSRIVLGVIGFGTVVFSWIFKSQFQHWSSVFLTLCLWVQASHGILEPPESTEFYQFCGIVYLIAALSYNGTFRVWLRWFAPMQLLSIVVPMVFKQAHLGLSVPAFIDTYSLPIVGAAIGSFLAYITSTKYDALVENLELQTALTLATEKKAKLQRELGAQVAHDIRSPLIALQMVTRHLVGVAEEKRIMIRNAVQRINDIANDLVNYDKSDLTSAEDSSLARKCTSSHLLSSLIEPLISEKRIQYRSRAEIKIQALLNEQSYGLFANVHSAEFKRMLSNLVNNAVEAIGESGEVVVDLAQIENDVIITVRDTGGGIPEDVIPKLMNRGVSFGKSTGSGLGLFHAKTMAEAWGGSLYLESTVGVGTTVTIKLPVTQQPSWFVDSIKLRKSTPVVILDDDWSIHEVWQGRFVAMDLEGSGIEVFHCSTVQEFVDLQRALGNQVAIYLCDYELLGEQQTGLDLIERFALQEKAILVSSRYEEPDVRTKCANLGLRILPKPLAEQVPIRITVEQLDDSVRSEELRAIDGGLQRVSACNSQVLVIDDDEGIRLAWTLEKESLGIDEIYTFESMEQCEDARLDYTGFDYAFIDKNIPDSQWSLGQVVAHLKNAGVKKVIVASGESQNDLEANEACQIADGILNKKIPDALYEI